MVPSRVMVGLSLVKGPVETGIGRTTPIVVVSMFRIVRGLKKDLNFIVADCVGD